MITIARDRREVVRVSREPSVVAAAPIATTPAAPYFKRSLLGHTQEVISAVYSPDGQLLATADLGGEVRAWDMPQGRLRYVLPSLGSRIHALTFSPDSSLLLSAAAFGDGEIRIWQADSGKPAGELQGHTKGLFDLSFTSDGKTLASAGWDATIVIWDFAARRQLRSIPSPNGEWVRSAVFCQAGNLGVTCGSDVYLMTSEGQILKKIDATTGIVSFSMDGRLLAAANWSEGRVAVCDVNSGQKIGEWRAHTGLINAAAFSPFGGVLGTVGSDSAIRLWDPDTQRQLVELNQEGEVCYLVFSPDGKTLATTGKNDKLIKLWDVSFLLELKLPGQSK